MTNQDYPDITSREPSTTLTGHDKRTLIIAAIIALFSIAVAWMFFDDAFPEAHIKISVDKENSTVIGKGFLESRGLMLDQYRHASVFSYDNQTKVYLERTLGLEKANQAISERVKLWRWSHRWFQSKQKEEFQVDVTPQGAIARFKHIIPEDATGADLSHLQAEVIAKQFLTEGMDKSLRELRFLEHSSTERPNRTDHRFTWESVDTLTADAGYRFEVLVQGSEIGGFNEYLKIPEFWTRNYKQLRSANETTGAVASFFLLLTLVAMLVVMIRYARNSDIRWKAAFVFGGIGFVLMLASQLNSLPLTLFSYETTDAYGDYITQQILFILLQSLLAGGGILFLTAAAEPLYRERYTGKLSLSRAFKLRGFRTKKFFMAVVVGLVTTCFFVAYQTLFYLGSSQLGAWAPADIPYSDLLNTAIPWSFVLLMGFFPAVSEEFMSRMFSIPFLEKYLKSRWIAVLIPALIWGFGHAAYPNQPFYIRGVEVSIAGVIVGFLMIKYGVIATLIWHYTVDALYTAFLLFGSGDTYLVFTGAVSTGIMLIPLVVAGAFYLKKGAFESDAGLTNRDEGTAPPKPTGAVKKIEIHYKRFSARKIITGILAGLILFCGIFLSGENPVDFVNVKLNRSEVQRIGMNWLTTLTDSTDTYVSAVSFQNQNRSQSTKYLLEHSGPETTRKILKDFLYPKLWQVRYFQPLEKSEFRLQIHPESGEKLAFRHVLPENEPGDSLTKEMAVSSAGNWLVGRGIDTSSYRLKSVEQIARPNRLDYDLVWEGTPNHWASVEEGKPQLKVSVLGSDIGAFARDYKLPEEWLRTRTAQTLGRTVHHVGRLVVLIAFIITGLVLLIVRLRREESFSWKPPLLIGSIVALLTVLMTINQWEEVLNQYITTIPWAQFQIGVIISVVLFAIILGGIIMLGTALSRLYYPGSLLAWKAPERYVFARDALITVLIAVLGFIGIQSIVTWIRLQFPEFALFPTEGFTSSIGTIIPAFDSIGRAFTRGLGYAVGLGLFTLLWNKYLSHPILKLLLILVIIFAFVPPRTLTWQEWLLQTGVTALPLLWAGFLWRYFIYNNYLSYPMVPMYLLGLAYGAQLYSQNGTGYIINGIIVFAFFTVLWFWTLADALRHREDASTR